MTLNSESFIFDPRPWYNLRVTAKRYWRPEDEPLANDPDALTLVLAHGNGFHKEQWEPTLDDLFELIGGHAKEPIKIREIWSIDCPNHGDAAVLNEEELLWGYQNIFGWEEYGRAIHVILTGRGTGIPVDFSKRKLVGIGHSMGAVALTLSTMSLPAVTYSSLIFVDPMMFPKPPTGTPEKPFALVEGAVKRRDVWPSRAEALESLQSRPSFKIWDPRVLRIFVEHGMRDLPTETYPDHETGVTLKCPKAQEAACFRDLIGQVRALEFLKTLCTFVPVHLIYGEIDDHLPSMVKDYVTTVGTEGKHASFARVPGVGHLIPQIQPKGLAQAIYAALQPIPSPKL